MPPSDSLADAATLLNYFLYRDNPDLEDAYRTGGWAIFHLANKDSQSAYNATILAARAAFRAVPGLRG